MIKHFDHLTIVVDDLADAKRFLGCWASSKQRVLSSRVQRWRPIWVLPISWQIM